MARPHITLSVSDERGRLERIAVEATRFTIGSSPDNDLTIDDSTLSRRHALIESFDGIVQLSDCGSASGILVNGRPIKGGVILQDGDTITVGTACHIRVSMDGARADSFVADNQTQTEQRVASRADLPGFNGRLSTPMLALIAVALILLVAVPVMIFLNKDGGNRTNRIARSKERESDNRQVPDPRRPETERDATSDPDAPSKAATIEEVEKIAVQFMRRISSDNRPYVFPSYAVNALGDVKKQIEQYAQSPAIASALKGLATAAPTIAAVARREGIEPGLIITAAMAETESLRAASDLAATARRILPDLLALRKTLGTESVDKSLILVAAYKMGGGTKKSHPLLRTMTRAVKNPLTDRNVWYLREHANLDDETYDFVVNFLALGIISENPQRFGIAAPRIAY